MAAATVVAGPSGAAMEAAATAEEVTAAAEPAAAVTTAGALAAGSSHFWVTWRLGASHDPRRGRDLWRRCLSAASDGGALRSPMMAQRPAGMLSSITRQGT